MSEHEFQISTTVHSIQNTLFVVLRILRQFTVNKYKQQHNFCLSVLNSIRQSYSTKPPSTMNYGSSWKTAADVRVAAALHFTVPMVWFLIEHHALNMFLKKKSNIISSSEKPLQEPKCKQMHVSKLYTPAVSGHTFVAAVFFVPVVALYSRVVAARPRTQAPQRHRITGPINLHLILEKREIFGRAKLVWVPCMFWLLYFKSAVTALDLNPQRSHLIYIF